MQEMIEGRRRWPRVSEGLAQVRHLHHDPASIDDILMASYRVCFRARRVQEGAPNRERV